MTLISLYIEVDNVGDHPKADYIQTLVDFLLETELIMM